MKVLFRTPKIIDVFLDDDVNPRHGWGRWSKFHVHRQRGQLKLIMLDGNPLSNEDFVKLQEELNKK